MRLKIARRLSFGFATIPVILGISVILLSIGAYFFGKNFSLQLFNKGAAQPTSSQSAQQTPSGWQSQTNQNFGLSFMLPKDWDSVEVSGSLVIAPLKVVEDVRDLVGRGSGFGGGTFLTMQIHILDEDYPPDTFKSTKDQEVSKAEKVIGGITATEYTTKHLTALPGIEEGAVVKTYLLSANGKKYAFSLLDKTQEDTLQKILSSIKFIKPAGSELSGKTKDEVKNIKGKPENSQENAKTKKEVWVYLNQGDESTATYVYFLNNKVSEVKLDEYNGTLDGLPYLK